ncbi:MAG: LLM class F420-dependent oxidoreductase [Chloroflexi bacterium]|nr:LLM class F420-dependent oxidoreductase [Chloroflexota bacterium]
MRMGLFIGGIGSAGSLESQITQILEAEKDGFHGLWAAHIMDVDIMSMMCLAAEKTSRIEMGTAVTPTFLRHPIAMAQQALTVQSIAGGRFTLGIGVNHKPVVEDRLGMEFHRPAQHMKEYLDIVRTLSRDGIVDYKGQIFSANTQFTIAERSHIPVLLAALGPRMLKTAGETADGTITWMTGVQTLKTHIVPTINRAAEGAGRDNPRIVAAVPVAVTGDRPAAFRQANDYFGRYGQLPSYRAMLDREGVESPAEMALVGDEEEVAEQLRAYADAGTTDMAAQIYPVGPDPHESIARSRNLLRSLIGKL